MGSPDCPQYKAAIVTAEGERCLVTQAVTGLSYGSSENEIAQRATLTLYNLSYKDRLLAGLFQPRDRVFLYANTGTGDREVFRGYLWDKQYESAREKILTWTCYDNLIYLQESEDSLWFSAGQSTAGVAGAICKKWGVSLRYEYASITHGKLALRGSLSDMLLSDLLEPVRRQTGQCYVLRSWQDVLCVERAGENQEVYSIKSKANALRTRSSASMSGMVTQVIVTGKTSGEGAAPIEAIFSSSTARYGTLQKVLSGSEGESLAEAKKEAEELLKEKSSPILRASVEAVDIPYLRKGDRVDLSAGDLLGKYLVLAVTHDGMRKTMELEVERLG